MKAVIAQFYKKEEDAAKRATELMKLWRNRVKFYVLTAPNGSLVVSESQVRKCYPDLFPKKKKVVSLGGVGGYCLK